MLLQQRLFKKETAGDWEGGTIHFKKEVEF